MRRHADGMRRIYVGVRITVGCLIETQDAVRHLLRKELGHLNQLNAFRPLNAEALIAHLSERKIVAWR